MGPVSGVARGPVSGGYAPGCRRPRRSSRVRPEPWQRALVTEAWPPSPRSNPPLAVPALEFELVAASGSGAGSGGCDLGPVAAELIAERCAAPDQNWSVIAAPGK